MASSGLMRAVNVEGLEYQMALRGWNWIDLSQTTGITMATLGRIKRGEPVSARTISKLLQVLRDEPASAIAEQLIQV